MLVRNGPSGPEGISSLPDSGSRKSTVRAVNLETGIERVVFEAGEPSGFYPIALSPDEKRVAGVFRTFADRSHETLRSVSLDDGGVEHLYELKQPLTRLEWMPDGSGILGFVLESAEALRSADGRYGAWFYPVPKGAPRKLFVIPGAIMKLAVSPDGKRIAYTSQTQSSEIWMLENFLPSLGRK